jgi:hypothetical protein
MRPWFLMGSAVALAFLLVLGILGAEWLLRISNYGGYGGIIIDAPSPHPFPSPMQTTVEEPGGVALGSEKGWDFICIALLTAPKTMKVDDTADVETDLLTSADRSKVDALMSAAQRAADAINKRSATTASDAVAGLDPEAADAIRRLSQETDDRQATVDSLPGSPITTAHLTGPGFEITPNTPERQAVTAKAPAIWRWTIKAPDAGERSLTVSYSAEVLVADQRLPKALRTISRTVLVSVAPGGLLKQVADDTSSAKSIAENTYWFWTTLILPALMFLYGLREWFRARHTRVSSGPT